MTFNLVPSLLVQLEAFAADRARDRFLELSLKPADALDPGRHRLHPRELLPRAAQHMIDVYPRYGELLARRGGGAPTPAERSAAAARFSVDDLRDLQVWHKLAWIDPFYLDARRADPRPGREGPRLHRGRQGGAARGRARAAEQGDSRVPGRGRRAARSRSRPRRSTIRSCRCSATPTSTSGPIPIRGCRAQRFRHPEDAAMQLERAATYHERLFGRRPVGLWPSEGSVSDAMVPLVAAAGFNWMATDELILARTLGLTFSRDGRGHVEQPERLYTPYVVRGRRREGRVRLPRPRAVGSHRLHLLRLGGGELRRRTSFSAWSRRGAATAIAPAGKRRSSRSSSTGRTPGSISRAAAGRSSGALPAAVRASRAADRDHGRGVRRRRRRN